MNDFDDAFKPAAQQDDAAPDGGPSADADRRAALRRLGPLAVLTPPAVMSLLVSKRASAQSAPPGDPPSPP